MYKRLESYDSSDDKNPYNQQSARESSDFRSSDEFYDEDLHELEKTPRMCHKVGITFSPLALSNSDSESVYSQLWETQENNSALSDQTYRKYLDEMYSEGDLNTERCLESFRNDTIDSPEPSDQGNQIADMDQCYLPASIIPEREGSNRNPEIFTSTAKATVRNKPDYQGNQMADMDQCNLSATLIPEREGSHRNPERFTSTAEAPVRNQPDYYSVKDGYQQVRKPNPKRRQYSFRNPDGRHAMHNVQDPSSFKPHGNSESLQHRVADNQPMARDSSFGKSSLDYETRASFVGTSVESESTRTLESMRSPSHYYDPRQSPPRVHGNRINTCNFKENRSTLESPTVSVQGSTGYQDRCYKAPKDIDELSRPCSWQYISDEDVYGKVTPTDPKANDEPVSVKKSYEKSAFNINDQRNFFCNNNENNTNSSTVDARQEYNPENGGTEPRRICKKCKKKVPTSRMPINEQKMCFAEMDKALASIEELLDRREKLNIRTDQLTGYFVTTTDLVFKESFQDFTGLDEEYMSPNQDQDNGNVEYSIQNRWPASDVSPNVNPSTSVMLKGFTTELGNHKEKLHCLTENTPLQDFDYRTGLKKERAVNRQETSTVSKKFNLPPIKKPAGQRPPMGEQKTAIIITDGFSLPSIGSKLSRPTQEKCSSKRPFKSTSESKERTAYTPKQRESTQKTLTKSEEKEKNTKQNRYSASVSLNQPKKRKNRRKYKSTPAIRRGKQRYKGAPVDLNVVESRTFWPGFDTVLPLVGRLKKRSEYT